MASELKPTPLLLAVLVLLWEAPMHPYQMQLLMRERRKDFVTDVKPGSIYHAIARLEPIIPGLAEKLIGSAAAVEGVISIPAKQRIVPAVALQ